MPSYSDEPRDRQAFTRRFDTFYTRFARAYDLAVKLLPVWRAWLRHALPHLQGPRVLEVSFGTGYLLTQYAERFETHGLEYNRAMVETASRKFDRAPGRPALVLGTVDALPYADASFDTVLSTMAFTGYPNARSALSELQRVLRKDGRLVMIDVNYPRNGNWLGTRLTQGWKIAGDLIRDMHALFEETGLDDTDDEVGGWGSVHLYVVRRS